MTLSKKDPEVVVVGGGAAGLSATLVLGRARVRTLTIDAGKQSNLPAHGIGGLLGHDGKPPAAFYEEARAEIGGYPAAEVRKGEIALGERIDGGFRLETTDGEEIRTPRVLLASGMDYRYPEIPGLAERWGGSVFHCPFCHGWEMRDRRLAVLDSGDSAVGRAFLLKGWSDDVTILANGEAGIDDASRDRLADAGIEVDERRIERAEGDGAALASVGFADGGERPVEGILVAVTLAQRSGLAAALGAELVAMGEMSDDAVAVDGQLRAEGVPGLFAAGDVTVRMPSVANSVAAGSMAAAAIVHSISSGR